MAKEAERRRCGHHELREPLSALECLESVVDPKGSGRNRFNYVVASQDEGVRRAMRAKAGVPLVYLKRSVMILEPMGVVSEEVREREEKGKVRAGLKGGRGAVRGGGKRKREESEDGGDAEVGGGEEPVTKKKKLKGPKGPNPLSVKKSKKEGDKKAVAKEVEDERSVLRKAAKQDPQVGEKALDAADAVEPANIAGVTDGLPRKRKRKRKPNETATGAGADFVTLAEAVEV